jgi:DNA polymerase elongation subunit (family B)
LKKSLKNIVDGNCPMDKLVITKSLRSGYKKPNSIAHKVLADRISVRDPGNKPSPGDRISYVYFVNNNKQKGLLQGDKIETPQFISENNLKIDYEFYITNQIMKPIQQVFALVLIKIWEMQYKMIKIQKFKKEAENLRKEYSDDKQFEDKLEKLKNSEIKKMLFDEYLIQSGSNNQGLQNISKFFKTKKSS